MARTKLSLIQQHVKGPYCCVICDKHYKQPPHAIDSDNGYWCLSCTLLQGTVSREKTNKKTSVKQAKKEKQAQKSQQNLQEPKRKKKAFPASEYRCEFCSERFLSRNRMRLHRCKAAEKAKAQEKIKQSTFLKDKQESKKRPYTQKIYIPPKIHSNPNTIKQCHFCLERVKNKDLSRHIDYCFSNPSNHA